MNIEFVRSINLRDLGGLRTRDGAKIQHGRVYRSASLTAMSDTLFEQVRALGIRTIIDLRHNTERELHPTPWEALGCSEYWCRDHHDSGADLGQKLREASLIADDSRALMIRLYRVLPYVQSESYGRLFKALAEGAGPVLFHCAVGKDRTGAAAALLLAALGVPYPAIAEDYTATRAFDLLGSPHLRNVQPMSAERTAALAPVLEVNPVYLDAMFEAVNAQSGSIEDYLRNTLGLSDQERAALRKNLITS